MFHFKDYGPSFYSALGLFGNPMKEANTGYSNTMNFKDEGQYNVATDAQGANVLTGSSFKH